MKYRHTPDMGEISGFGGGYENACQNMLEAGIKWLMDEKNAGFMSEIKTQEFRGIYGVLTAESEDAKALEKTILAVCDDCTEAMHHAVMNRLSFIAKNGWEKYCEELRDDKETDR